jgi:hypothetical protein
MIGTQGRIIGTQMQMVKGLLCWWSPRQGGPLAAHGRQKARSVGPPPFPHPKRSRSPSRSTPSTNHPARSTPHHRRGLDGPAPARLLVLPPRPSAGSFGGGLTVTRCLGHSDPSSPSASSTRGATTPFQDSPLSSQPGLAFARACDRDGLCLALFGCSRGGLDFSWPPGWSNQASSGP